MYLTNSSAKLTAYLGSAFTTTAPTFAVTYRPVSASGSAQGGTCAVGSISSSSSSTPTTLLAGSATAGLGTAQVESVNVYNVDTVAATVNVSLAIAGTAVQVAKVTLAVGDTLEYSPAHGWVVTNSSGQVKQVSSAARTQQFGIGPAPVDTFAATMTIDMTYSLHVIAVANGTSATCTMTPSGPGTAGDVVEIITEADSSGTVTVTFASTFHSSGTQATTLSKFSSIRFLSDGTRWIETNRTTALT